MSDWELIQQRSISGKGILKVPTDAKKNRAYLLYSAVFREPLSKYANFNYNPPRSRYGTLVFLRNDYVVDTQPIEYKKQAFDGVNDISGQTLLAVKCAYEGILESIYRLSVNLAATPGSIGLTPVNYTNGIADYENLRLAWDECRLVCYADTAIQLSLYRLKYDVCNEDFDKDREPPPPPPPPPEVPPGTPIVGIDPPYEGDDDDGNTVPYPEDEPPEPEPGGEDCQAYVIVIQYDRVSDETDTRTTTVGGYGPIGGARVSPSDASLIELQCRGIPAAGACNTYGWYGVFATSSATVANVSILTIT